LKVALAYAFGLRTDSTLKQLLERLIPFKLALYCTDNWGAYERLLPEDKHLITKRATRKALNDKT
jgi:insertion element IS1 protein InsB